MRVSSIGGVSNMPNISMDERTYDRISAGLDRGTKAFNLRDCPATEQALKAIQNDYGLDYQVEKLSDSRMTVRFL